MKLITSFTVGKGPVHMKSVNGSAPSLINIFKSGPITYEHGYTQGGNKSLLSHLGTII
jgi:hypothetical protein